MNKIFYVLENNSGDVVQLYKNDDENVVRAYEKVGVFKKLNREFSEGKTFDDVVAIYKQFGFKFSGMEII